MRYVSEFGFLLAGLIGLISPATSRAQAAHGQLNRNFVAVSGGSFIDDVNGDASALVGGIRLGRFLNRYLVAELVTGYSTTSTKSVDLQTFAVQQQSTPFLHADVALEAQIPWVVAPYIGVATGLFHRSSAAGMQSEHGAGISAAAGTRIWATKALFAQGELRARQDHYSYGDVHNFEMTVSVGGSF